MYFNLLPGTKSLSSQLFPLPQRFNGPVDRFDQLPSPGWADHSLSWYRSHIWQRLHASVSWSLLCISFLHNTFAFIAVICDRFSSGNLRTRGFVAHVCHVVSVIVVSPTTREADHSPRASETTMTSILVSIPKIYSLLISNDQQLSWQLGVHQCHDHFFLSYWLNVCCVGQINLTHAVHVDSQWNDHQQTESENKTAIGPMVA